MGLPPDDIKGAAISRSAHSDNVKKTVSTIYLNVGQRARDDYLLKVYRYSTLYGD